MLSFCVITPIPFPTVCRAAAVLAAGVFALGTAAVAHAALPPEKRALLPAAAQRPVDFARDIQPIFEASCVQCHGHGKAKGAFSLETRADFLFGGDAGTPAVAGHSGESLVVDLISGLDPETVMPKKGRKLTTDQVAVFRAWIDQGLPWPQEITFAKREPANLRPRDLAALPVPRTFPNPIDGYVDALFTQDHVAWPATVDDRTYARRVWLDTIGLLPPPAELEAFLADRAADKRTQLVQRLLADHQGYAEHWLTFWNDLLRNDYKGTGYIDGGRKPITTWLYTALARNLPYDRFVAQLVDPGTESEGFVNGILWRGAVNASMVPPMQAAQSVAQVFLGVNLKCASCHDSFINDYTLKDAYGLASIYADAPLEIAECDKPTGHIAQVKFLYSELGLIDAQADSATRKRQLADVIIGRANGRLPRTIVNRLWQRFLGHGLVEPVDEMDRPAWSPALLDWLAEDLVAHGYDLKHTMARILTSQAYQLPAVNGDESGRNFVFRGPLVRRLSAEQFSDAIMTLTGRSYPKADAKLNREVALQQAASAPLPLSPQWIWATPQAQLKARPASVVFTRTVTLATAPTEAWLTIAADNTYAVALNGKTVASASKRTSTGAESYDVKANLRPGDNTIKITCVNFLADGTTPVAREAEGGRKPPPPPDSDNPAGLILYARVRGTDPARDVMDFVSDRTWTATAGPAAPAAAVELGGVELAPWRLGGFFLELAAARKENLPVHRASLVAADPLMAALGRPNREQVVTVRQETATTLQALELTNGRTLAQRLGQGAEQLLAGDAVAPGGWVRQLYLQALGRAPNAAERAASERFVGTPATAEGVQDLLWALAMLPEFQLIN